MNYKCKSPVIILAGGFGTRLSSILGNNPKPLADISGTPFIILLLKKLIENGYSDFIFSLHYKADVIIDTIESYPSLKKYNKKYIIESQPLGTGGGVLYSVCASEINADFLVVNSDSIIDNGYHLFDFAKSPTIGLVKINNTARYGIVKIDINLKIIEFVEKNSDLKSGIINAGIYKLNKSHFKKFNSGDTFSLELDIFPELVKENQLSGIILKTNFIDIGIPEDYHRYCQIVK